MMNHDELRSVDGSEIRLRLTSWGKGSECPIIYKVLAPSQVVGNGISEASTGYVIISSFTVVMNLQRLMLPAQADTEPWMNAFFLLGGF